MLAGGHRVQRTGVAHGSDHPRALACYLWQGGGATLLQSACVIGHTRDFEKSDAFTEALFKPLSDYFDERFGRRCDDRLTSSQHALAALRLLTPSGDERDPKISVKPPSAVDPFGSVTLMLGAPRDVPNAMCEVLLFSRKARAGGTAGGARGAGGGGAGVAGGDGAPKSLLEHLSALAPTSDQELVEQLVADCSGLWPTLLRMTSAYDLIVLDDMHPEVKRVRHAIITLNEQLAVRSCQVDQATALLWRNCLTRGAYAKVKCALLLLFGAVGIVREGELPLGEATAPVCVGDMNQTRTLLKSLFEELEALEHFFQLRCPDAPDLDEYRAQLVRCQQIKGRTVQETTTEEYWGPQLAPQLREVAVQAFRLRNSQAFDTLWKRENALAAGSADAGAEDDRPTPLTVGQAVDKYRTTRAAFDQMIRGVVVNPEVSFREISDLFGREIQDIEQEIRNLSIIAQGANIDEAHVLRLANMLREFARLVPTLESASAVQRFADVVCQVDEYVESEIGKEAKQLLEIARNPQHPLRISVEASKKYNRHITEWELISEMVPTLGDREGHGMELVEFLRLNGDSVRDLADAGDSNELAEVVTSLQTVYKLLRPILGLQLAGLSPPKSIDEAFQRLTESATTLNLPGIQIAGRLSECCQSIKGLKSLHANLTDRTQRSKMLIRSVVEEGTWVFRSIGTSEGIVAEFRVEFAADDARDMDSATINDLRSRVRLIINSKHEELAEDRETFLDFIELVKAADGINLSIAELAELGHFDAYEFGTTRPMKFRTLEQLRETDISLRAQCVEWRQALMTVRRERYLTTFFCSQQLWQLQRTLVLEQVPATQRTSLLTFVPAGPANAQDDHAAAEEAEGIAAEGTDGVDDDSAQRLREHLRKLRHLGGALDSHFAGCEPIRRTPEAWSESPPRQATVVDGEVAWIFVHGDGVRSNMIETCLALYAGSGMLPEHSQLLFCHPSTTREELDAFLLRAFHSFASVLTRGRLFTALRVSALAEDAYIYLIERCTALQRATEPRTFRLALLCSRDDELRARSSGAKTIKHVEPLSANEMQAAISDGRVRVVQSAMAGLGKTQYIQSCAEAEGLRMRSLPISGPTTRAEVVTFLQGVLDAMDAEEATLDALHIDLLDVPTACADEVNDMLFELICLHAVSNKAASTISYQYVGTPQIFIEVANTVTDNLLERVPLCTYFRSQPDEGLKWSKDHNPIIIDERDVESAWQWTLIHLDELSKGTLDTRMPRWPSSEHCRPEDFETPFGGKMPEQLSNALFDVTPIGQQRARQLLEQYFVQRVREPSFQMLHAFVVVLAEQLRRFNASFNFRVDFLWEHQQQGFAGATTLRSIFVTELVNASVRFAERSVKSRAEAAANERLEPLSFRDVNYLLIFAQAEGACAHYVLTPLVVCAHHCADPCQQVGSPPSTRTRA